MCYDYSAKIRADASSNGDPFSGRKDLYLALIVPNPGHIRVNARGFGNMVTSVDEQPRFPCTRLLTMSSIPTPLKVKPSVEMLPSNPSPTSLENVLMVVPFCWIMSIPSKDGGITPSQQSPPVLSPLKYQIPDKSIVVGITPLSM